MNKFLKTVGQVKDAFVQVTQAGFALVGFIILVYLLLGEGAGPYVISVIANVLLLLGAVSPQALVAFAIALAIAYLMQKRG